ncbi:hypothetical protein IW139_002723 [Coemansia sp. RSA 353]|nr:hypothetical protein GGH97_002801 [Coemansia sp. RSA 475]KAJ2297650.1 hypothetical protein IW139_002723 [Coemansia sp. RSA 353]
MWSHFVLVAGAFGLGYYVATRGSGKKTETHVDEPDTHSSMVGAFPETNSGQSNDTKRENVTSKTAKPKRKKNGRKQEPEKLLPDIVEAKPKAEPSAVAVIAPKLKPTPIPESRVEPKAGTMLEPKAGTMLEPKAGTILEPKAESLAEPDAEPVLEADPRPEEWESVGTTGVRPLQKTSNPIPTHKTAWSNITTDVDLNQNNTQQPPQHRVLRMSARTQPPPPPAPRREPKGPLPLTKKQRQSRKKAERLREERAQAATIQEQRLHSHQREQFDMRSREQWKQEQQKMLRGPQNGKAPSQAKNAPSLVDGKLIWD